MRTKWWIPVLTLSLAINAAALATVGYNHYANNSIRSSALCPVSSGNQHLYRALGLSGPQLVRMDALAQRFHAKLERLDAEMEGKRGLMIELLRQKEVDSERVEKLRKEMAGIHDDIQREVITHIKEIKKILNPEQSTHFFNLLRTSMEHDGSRWPSENREK